MKMQAISFVKEKPQVIQTDKPSPRDDEVLVKVVYSALDTALSKN